jgi:VIT1/CCC1 family predicted Fe2+/Mn2+ transporter
MRRTVIAARQRAARTLRQQRERRQRWALAPRIAVLGCVAALLAWLLYPLFKDAVVSAIVSGLVLAIFLALLARSGERAVRETE